MLSIIFSEVRKVHYTACSRKLIQKIYLRYLFAKML